MRMISISRGGTQRPVMTMQHAHTTASKQLAQVAINKHKK